MSPLSPGAELTERIASAWKRAAQDLGFQWVERFTRVTPDSRSLNYLGLARHFGREGGTMVRLLQLGEYPGLSIWDADYVIAKIGDSFADYDRQLWIDTLSRWGWAGPSEKRPHWLLPD